jgi:type 1 glutamine amidotransferase
MTRTSRRIPGISATLAVSLVLLALTVLRGEARPAAETTAPGEAPAEGKAGTGAARSATKPGEETRLTSPGNGGTAAPAASPLARVVIITGQDYPGHKWKETAPVVARQLGKDPRLAVRVVEDPSFLASRELLDYDVVVLHFMNWETPDPGPAARENLRKAVDGGKGLFLIHFACGAFQDWPEFRNLAGRSYDPKLRGHDPHGAFRVEIRAKEHPVTRGLEGFEVVDELYTCLAGDRPIDLLATARSKVDGKDYPMAFSFDYGKGHVFHSPLGHDTVALENAAVGELFRRACAWLAGLPPVPAATAPPPDAAPAPTASR